MTRNHVKMLISTQYVKMWNYYSKHSNIPIWSRRSKYVFKEHKVTNLKNDIQKAILTAVLFKMSGSRKNPVLKESWIYKMWWYISTMEYYSAIWIHWILLLRTMYMALQVVIRGDLSQNKKDIYKVILLFHCI